jgi:hypothetical protein
MKWNLRANTRKEPYVPFEPPLYLEEITKKFLSNLIFIYEINIIILLKMIKLYKFL